MRFWMWILIASVWAGCSEMAPKPTASLSVKPRDGALALPGHYMVWPKFLSEVQRPDVKQVRELFINAAGMRTQAGQSFPNGTVMVMELYTVKMKGETPETGADGKLIKGDLAKVFVMGKGDGWGQDVPDGLKNGNWVFAAYGPDGTALPEDFSACRVCHASLAAKDFVHRYDEYFEKRAVK